MWLLALCLVSSLACKPTVERESREWSDNIQSVAEFQTRWPGFEPVLASAKTEAEGLMSATDKISNEEARAEAMDAANKVLSPLVGKLRAVSNKLDELDRDARRLDKLSVPLKQQSQLRDTKAAAMRVGREVSEAMAKAAPTTEAEATRFLDEQIGRLDGSIGACEDTFERLSEPEPSKSKRP